MTRNNPNGSPLDDEEFDPLADDAPSPEIEAIIAERDEYRDRFMRALADAENARKRADKDRRDAEQYGGSRLARDLLPVYDALSRALDSAGDDQRAAAAALIEGVELTLRELKNVFAKHGITVITPELGEKFDPNLHAAVAHEDDESYGENEVILEMLKGYKYKDKVIRHSMVKVAN